MPVWGLRVGLILVTSNMINFVGKQASSQVRDRIGTVRMCAACGHRSSACLPDMPRMPQLVGVQRQGKGQDDGTRRFADPPAYPPTERQPDPLAVERPIQTNTSREKSMSRSSTEVVEELIDAIANSNAEKLLGTLADDVTWTFFGSHRFAGTFRGKDELMNGLFAVIGEVLEDDQTPCEFDCCRWAPVSLLRARARRAPRRG